MRNINIKDICFTRYDVSCDETMVKVDTENPKDWNIEAEVFNVADAREFLRKDGKDIEDDMNEAGFEYVEDYDISYYPKYYPETDDARIIVVFKDFTDGSAERKFNELCDNLKTTKDNLGYEETEIILTDDEKAELKGMLLDFFEKDKRIYEIYEEAKEDMKKEAKTEAISKD